MEFGWLVLVALVTQAVVIYVGFGELGVIRRFIFPSSYVLLLAFIVLNWRRVGFVVVGVGVVLNLLAIVTNGGLMPVSPAAMERAGLQDELVGVDSGDPLPLSKNVLLDESDTNFQWLSDRIPWDSPGPVPLLSVGDIVVVIGLVALVVEFLLPHVVRRLSQSLT